MKALKIRCPECDELGDPAGTFPETGHQGEGLELTCSLCGHTEAFGCWLTFAWGPIIRITVKEKEEDPT